MTTDADFHRERARESVQNAIIELARIVVEQCPGATDYTREYQEALAGALQALILLRNAL